MKDIETVLNELDAKYRENMLDNRQAGFTFAANRWEHQRWTIDEIREQLRLERFPTES